MISPVYSGKNSETVNPSFPNRTTYAYNGPMLPAGPNVMSFPTSIESSTGSLNAIGADAIALCKPDNSVANLTTFLGETIREGLPHLVGATTWKDRALTAKNAGGEYLNVQFGWRPLISDITSFGSGVVNANTVLKQYERDAGKTVRRSFYFPLVTSDKITELGSGSPYGGQWGNHSGFTPVGKLSVRRETRIARWFKGAFVYYLPSGYDSRNQMDKMALLADRLGLQLTPETLWNLAPWSWAVDWFTNTGSVLSNVSSFAEHGLVMRYGYLMESTMVKDTYTLRDINWGSTSGGPSALTTSLVTETKRRVKANPYGFGITWEGLSPFQISILSALGLSRGR